MNKRKNSFKFGRRRSRSLVGSITNEICSIIDKSLPQSERLQLLTKQALDNALTVAERECNEQTDHLSFKISCSEYVEKIDSAVELQNNYVTSTSDEELTGINISLNEKWCNFSAVVAKLEEESAQWDAFTANYRKDLDKEKDLSVKPFNGSFDYKDYEKLNYSELYEDVIDICNQKKLQIEKLKKTRRKFKSCMKLANKYMSSLNENIECYFVNSVQETPRTLIRQCIAKGQHNA